MIDIKELGQLIKSARTSKKLTQVELARLANLSRRYLADVEAGRYYPSLVTLCKTAKVLDIDLGVLIKTGDNDGQ